MQLMVMPMNAKTINARLPEMPCNQI